MSDRITSKSLSRSPSSSSSDSTSASISVSISPSASISPSSSASDGKYEPEPELTTLPPKPNQRKFFIVAAILIFGLPLLGFFVGTFVF